MINLSTQFFFCKVSHVACIHAMVIHICIVFFPHLVSLITGSVEQMKAKNTTLYLVGPKYVTLSRGFI